MPRKAMKANRLACTAMYSARSSICLRPLRISNVLSVAIKSVMAPMTISQFSTEQKPIAAFPSIPRAFSTKPARRNRAQKPYESSCRFRVPSSLPPSLSSFFMSGHLAAPDGHS